MTKDERDLLKRLQSGYSQLATAHIRATGIADVYFFFGVTFDDLRYEPAPEPRADVCAEIAEILRDQYESLDMDRRRALADRLSP